MSQMTIAMFRVSFRSSWIRPVSSVLWCPLWFPRKIDVRFGSCCISVICIYLRILMSNTSSCLAESANPSGPRLFSGVHVARSLVFCILFHKSLFVLLWFFALPLCCLSFDLRLLVPPVVSSNCFPSKKVNNVSTWNYYAIILSTDCWSLILQCKYFYDTCSFWRILSAHDGFLE